MGNEPQRGRPSLPEARIYASTNPALTIERNDSVGEDMGHASEDRFGRILREFGPALSRLAYGYERVAGLREELAQEIALAIWQALPSFRGECSERTFVYRIAHNRGLTHASRRQPAHEALDEMSPLAEPADPRPHPEEQAVKAGQRDRLRSAIQRLPLAYRQVVMLMLEDLSHAEIGEVLGHQREQRRRAAEPGAQGVEGSHGGPIMSADLELEAWQQEWRSQADPLPDLKKKIRRQNVRMVVAIVMICLCVAVSATLAWRMRSLFFAGIAAGITFGGIVMGSYALRVRRGAWKPSAQTTLAYAELSYKRAVAKARMLHFSSHFLAVMLILFAGFSAWNWRAVHVREFATFGALVAEAIWLKLYGRRKTREITKCKKLLDEVSGT